jgi:hypothetical protein
MPEITNNKFRAAISVLEQGRDLLVESLADDIIDQGEELTGGGYLFNELLETQGTRLHFLSILIGQLEQCAEAHEEAHAPPPAPKRKSKPRSPAKKVEQPTSKESQTSKKSSSDDV